MAVNDNEAHARQEALLAAQTPLVLIGTAARVRSLLPRFPTLLDAVQMVVVDEVDEVLRLPGRYAPLAKLAERARHPKQSELLLNELVLKNGKARKTSV